MQKIRQVIINYHFWIILAIVIVLIVIYYAWPWRYLIHYLHNLALIEFKYKIIGSLFIIPLTYAFIVFRWPGVLAGWLVYTVAILPRFIQIHMPIDFVLRSAFIVLIPLMITVIVSFEIKFRKNMTQREKERQNYMSQIFTAQEDERCRIARELHDETSQSLVSLGMDIDSLIITREHLSDKIVNLLVELRDRTNDILQGVRDLSQGLRPPMLKELGLLTTLRGLIKNLSSHQRIKAQLRVYGNPRRLSLESELVLFRIVQEALNNIVKHAQATKAVVRIQFDPQNVKIEISDNGRGFQVPKTTGGFTKSGKMGLVGMLERTRLLNGTLVITSKLVKGTTLLLEVKQ